MARCAGLSTIGVMKVLLAIMVTLSLAGATRAETFIYKSKIKYTYSGGGESSRATGSGWIIINDAGQVMHVLAFAPQRRFAIVPLQSIEFYVVDGGAGKLYTCFIQRDVWTDGNGHVHTDTGGAKGLNTRLVVNGTEWSMPKSFKWGGRSTYPALDTGEMRFEESTGTFVLDKKWTATSNAEGDDINAAAQRLAASLVEKGYIEF